ncbi:hypothetical protein [Burkholderia contaminans]|nr:hypothetical protein [Burkholderia contaminans]
MKAQVRTERKVREQEDFKSARNAQWLKKKAFKQSANKNREDKWN